MAMGTLARGRYFVYPSGEVPIVKLCFTA